MRYKVRVFSNGWVNLCEYDREAREWKDCVFFTREDAQEALDRYNEDWIWDDHKGYVRVIRQNGYVYESEVEK